MVGFCLTVVTFFSAWLKWCQWKVSYSGYRISHEHISFFFLVVQEKVCGAINAGSCQYSTFYKKVIDFEIFSALKFEIYR